MWKQGQCTYQNKYVCRIVCITLKSNFLTICWNWKNLPCDLRYSLRWCTPALQHLPNLIVDIKCRGERVIVSDVQESVFFVRYKRQENQLIIYMDDTNQRFITTSVLLDYDTVACADKFGNISVVSNVLTCSNSSSGVMGLLNTIIALHSVAFLFKCVWSLLD